MCIFGILIRSVFFWCGQREDITVAIVDDEGLSLQLREDLRSVAEAALKVAENLRGAIFDEERRR